MVDKIVVMIRHDFPIKDFQRDNHGKGGKGGDSVILNTQDPGLNNANFRTPPDGQRPQMNMYLFTKSKPWRDSSLDTGVALHEYTHGLSNRLTGGPDNAGCLDTTESGGLGEGWGDFLASLISLKSTATRPATVNFGKWIVNNPTGIRAYPYSTELKVNHMFILYEVLWNLIDKHGITDNGVPRIPEDNGAPKDGGFLAAKLVIDGLALQPCSPSLIQARDAILDADKALTGGENQAEIWKGFAKRGLGVGAKPKKGGYADSFEVPAGH
ncbi:hypothetical protein NLG97_g2908 [Lecanicillium saksenae]|uniref:Uncharacterized protein n=1 Tax=Lecanicillium saksenae TaxID=468837 RepID=A0ACC1R287_9HYPO|nr:hypothetical protein NLG97_g2908 [Lecanicillium saksenae]